MAKMLCILLQRSHDTIPWGIRITGGVDFRAPITIQKVTHGSLASQHLSPGDVIVSIQGLDTSLLYHMEASDLIREAGNSLELTVWKRSSNPSSECPSSNGSCTMSPAIGKDFWPDRFWPANCTSPLPDYHIRQNNQVSGGGSPATPPSAPSEPFAPASSPDGGAGSPPACPPPPPPPPPPPANMPSLRISSEINQPRLSPGMPPPAIQNAMLTKDKKPFTYTPGGIDLSEIRSPRMQKRISRNAMSEGVCNDVRPAAPAASQPLPPQAMAAMQPQIAVPVFPQGVPVLPPPPPPPPPVQRPPSPPPAPKMTPPTMPTSPRPVLPTPTMPPPPRPVPTTPTTTMPPPPRPVPTSPTSPTTFKNEPGSIYVPPVVGTRPESHAVGAIFIPLIPEDQQQPTTPQSPYPNLNKTPMPWMNSQQRKVTPPAQPQQAPPWVHQQQDSPPWSGQQQQQPPWVGNQRAPAQQQQARVIPVQREEKGQQGSGSQQGRIIPIQVEGRSPPVTTGRPGGQQQQQQRPAGKDMPSSGGERIIPIQVEGQDSPKTPQWQQQQQQRWPQQQGSNSPGADVATGMNNLNMRDNNGGPKRGPVDPIQSRSFRILQQFTDADEPAGARTAGNNSVPSRPYHTLPKMPMTEDDRKLMNMFRAQVSEDLSNQGEENLLYRGGHIPSKVFRILDESVDEGSYLHSEVDPRYRGPNIPSRAFRVLQTMTDTAGNDLDVPRGAAMQQSTQRSAAGNQRESQQQMYVHPSQQQQMPEPKKYTGSSIPSRSFRMLQAMTPQEDCETMRSETLDKGKDTQQTENAHEQFESIPVPVSHLRGQCDSLPSTYGPPSHQTLGYDDFVWDPYLYYPYFDYWYPPPSHAQQPQVQQVPNRQQQQRRSFIPSKSFRYLQMMYDNFHDYCDFFPDESGGWYGDWYGYDGNGGYDEDWGVSVEVADVPKDYRPDVPPEEFRADSRQEVSDVPPSEPPSVPATESSEVSESEQDCSVLETSDEGHSCVEGVVEEPSSISDDATIRAVKSVHDLRNDELTIRTDDSSSTSGSDGEDDDEGDESDSTESNNDDADDQKKYAVDEPRDDAESVECGDEWQFVRSQCCRHRGAVPRQLSVIYEESEHSAVSDTDSGRAKKPSLRQPSRPVSAAIDECDEDEARTEHDSDTTVENHSTMESDSSATLASGNRESDDDGSDVDEDSTVTVRLPLRLQFSKSADESDVATLIVGNSKIEVDKSDKGSDSETKTFQVEASSVTSALEAAVSLATKHQDEMTADESSVNNDEESDDDDSSSDETDSENKEPIANQGASGKIDNVMNDLSVEAAKKDEKKPKFHDLALEALLWHFKRYLQENLGSEDDSGVADMSRQLSDVETEDTEADKRKCQRAKTHSRLFELLQEECKQPEELVQVIQEVIDEPKPDDRIEDLRRRRTLLNLPVGPAAETPGSSGIVTPSLASPTSPTTREKLIAELIQELQRRTCTKSAPPLRDVFQWMQDELAQGDTTANNNNTYEYDTYYQPDTYQRVRCPKWVARCPRTTTAKCTNNETKVAPTDPSQSTQQPNNKPEDSNTNNNTSSS